MSWDKDITGTEAKKEGTFRSLNGAADESIFQGRATKAGFYCFFKVWRDMPYDAIVDYEGNLLRIEVKGSSGDDFNVTRGSRSGQQILRGQSRTKTLSRSDCDFVVCVDSNTGDCYIVPEDVVEILDTYDLSKKTLASYKEKWKLFMHGDSYNTLTADETRRGIRSMTQTEKIQKLHDLGVAIPTGPVTPIGKKKKITNLDDVMVYLIWEAIAKKL